MKKKILKPNYRDKKGVVCVVRCPVCNKENYAPAVALGICVWCGHNPTLEEELHEICKGKRKPRK